MILLVHSWKVTLLLYIQLAYYIGGPDLFCKQESIRGTLEGIAAELTVMDFLLFMIISGPSE